MKVAAGSQGGRWKPRLWRSGERPELESRLGSEGHVALAGAEHLPPGGGVVGCFGETSQREVGTPPCRP